MIPPSMSPPIPVSIITGFLGSGKTTLLNRLLQDPAIANSLVIINEFGEIGIDHLLVSTPSENMRLLSNGCLCCTVRGDLVETLADAARKRREGLVPAFDRVLVETTGLADPVPIIQTVVTDEEVAPGYRLDTVIGLVDAVHARAQFDNHPESVKQAAIADLLLVSKTDIGDGDEVAALESRLREINASAEVLKVVQGAVDPRLLFGRGTLDSRSRADDVERWLGTRANHDASACDLDSHEACAHDHHGHVKSPHGDAIQTFTLFHEQPATASGLAMWLSLLASFRGANLLRVKGLINVDGRPVVVHAVQTVIHEPVELAAWPSADMRSRVVFIVRGMRREALEKPLSVLSMAGIQPGGNRIDPDAYAQFVEMMKAFM
jgi:G3E family GTPase